MGIWRRDLIGFNLIINSFIALFIGLVLIPAHAETRQKQFYLEETFFPNYVYSNDTNSVTTSPGVATESGIGYQVRSTIGYVAWGKLLLGLTYNYYNLHTNRPYIAGGDSSLDETTTKSEWGPSLGYFFGPLRLIFTYFLEGEQQVNTQNSDDTGLTGDVTIKKNKMTGFQLTIGYAFALSQTIELGPTVVYRNVSYAEQSKVNRLSAAENYEGASLYSPAVEGTLSPMISLIIGF